MIGPGRAVAAAISLAASGCFHPVYDDCRVACTADEDCAPGHACGAAGLCATSDDPLACGDPPISPTGLYALTLTDQENGCKLADWRAGNASSAAVEIRERDAVVTAVPQGNLAMSLADWLGTSTFTGPHRGARLELVLAGTRSYFDRGCVYTFDATIDATLAGHLLEGSLFYRARTNGAWGCAGLAGCASRQALRGARPPPP
jgi:hypothetical protein